jgi:hypothetical protein
VGSDPGIEIVFQWGMPAHPGNWRRPVQPGQRSRSRVIRSAPRRVCLPPAGGKGFSVPLPRFFWVFRKVSIPALRTCRFDALNH